MNDTMPLEGRHALVTGGSRGIGLAIAQRLACLGARVTLMGRDHDSLQTALSALDKPADCGVVSGDVSRQEDVRTAFEEAARRRGAIDILINNAGQAESQRFDRLD